MNIWTYGFCNMWQFPLQGITMNGLTKVDLSAPTINLQISESLNETWIAKVGQVWYYVCRKVHEMMVCYSCQGSTRYGCAFKGPIYTDTATYTCTGLSFPRFIRPSHPVMYIPYHVLFKLWCWQPYVAVQIRASHHLYPSPLGALCYDQP